MKVLDTTFLIDFLRGKAETRRIIQGKETLLTTQINMYEIIRGLFWRDVRSSKVLEIMELFEQIKVLPLDDSAVVKSAEISTSLMKKGAIVPDNDCLIAGISLSKNISTIVTRNVEHFKRIKGIDVEMY